MTDSSSILTFVIVSFCLAIILIMKKDSLPAQTKRYLALLAIVMVSISFVLILLSFFHVGS
ncbi:hypothetical protein [Paenibacillus roseipurpureus]|uniref:Signal transduction histidine kinase n=1 Tax=Paenibacillus roseopurpureus TaxID=2918901 RepID=A0AA96LP10_9BACL|nr:hypothetical protein [Paenibacillus sp. MBLB1832]WNR43213.1 hypothetical protein MJB10_19150 [Paenibacillus sp. MBLB1832]